MAESRQSVEQFVGRRRLENDTSIIAGNNNNVDVCADDAGTSGMA